jgi:rare lipoprotein A
MNQKISILILMLLFLLIFQSCGPKHRVLIDQRRIYLPERIEKRESFGVQYGVASWYGGEFHGRPTSSGEIYDMYQLTCAHNTLPLGTTVMVTNLENGRSLECKINDRGPFVKDRIIDLSYAGAKILGMWAKGTAFVKVEVINPVIEQIQWFTCQVGSFIEEIKAKDLAENLKNYFGNVYISRVETGNEKYHRVRIGQFETKEEANLVAERLSKMGFNVLITSR